MKKPRGGRDMVMVMVMVVMVMSLMMACLTSHPSHAIAASISGGHAPQSSERLLEPYLVHVKDSARIAGNSGHQMATAADWHASLVSVATSAATIDSSSSPHPRILYSYSAAFQGFAALLTPAEAASLAAFEEVMAIEKDTPARVDTTRTPSFLGLDVNKHRIDSIAANYSSSHSPSPDGSNLWSASSQGRDTIIAILDTGIWPDHPSFSDAGFDEVPASWNGSCEPSFPCNRKLIGAKSFSKGYEAANRGKGINETVDFKSPRDSVGHGTHTASIAAGSPVMNASFLGLAMGTASGMAPLARLSVYKVCWDNGLSCYYSDILAAMDAAISDGVDVISLSLGGDSNGLDYAQDVIALGAFAAAARGIVVTCSAGNRGPAVGSVNNGAPWIFTVGASTIDRDFLAPLVLGNGEIYEGSSLYVGEASVGPAGIVQARDAVVEGGDALNASVCGSVSLLNSTLVEGKIVFCERGGGVNRVLKGLVVAEAGGIGMILGNGAAYGEELTAQAHLLPSTLVGFSATEEIRNYSSVQEASPTARIYFNGSRVGHTRAPVMAAFSSRGPNPLSLDVLKPDFTAPGVNILAAWSGFSSPSGLDQDPRRVLFNVVSGTSMSCPHVAGLSALLRAAHPTWTPAAIKSALMTTAKLVDDTGKPISDSASSDSNDIPLALGAGHVNPNAAFDPGLIYDIQPDDYLRFLCALRYNGSMLATFSETFSCDSTDPSLGDLNYPSITAVFPQRRNDTSNYSSTFVRTATNVGSPNSTYVVDISPPYLVNVSISPTTLRFNSSGQKLSYTITFNAPSLPSLPQGFAFSFGSLHWYDDLHHIVRSPISFIWYDAENNPSVRTTQH